jgi:hypothetical protein
MRTPGPMDGSYFFLFAVPFMLSIWVGDLLRKKIVQHLLLDRYCSQNLSSFVGASVQISIMIIGIMVGYFLTKLI